MATRPAARSVHPRACGEQASVGLWLQYLIGSSPRVRGTVLGQHRQHKLCRFIPARAGNSCSGGRGVTAPTVHPRACGEQLEKERERLRVHGSSPRVRGTDGAGVVSNAGDRFIPARAGNRCSAGAGLLGFSVHPRACGEQSGPSTCAFFKGGSSPRVRGTDNARCLSSERRRFIPARAGNRMEIAKCS